MPIDKQRKKELAAAYTESFRSMGVYQIRNVSNGKILVCGSMDLEGAANRLAFMKQTNMNTIMELREDWTRYGKDSFVFEELDQITPRKEALPEQDERKKYQEDVDALLELWLDKLQPYGEKGYNRPKRDHLS